VYKKARNTGSSLLFKIGWRLALAVIVPVTVLIRFALDSNEKALELGMRNIMAEHIDASTVLDSALHDYRDAIRKLGLEYQNDASLKSFKGNDDPSLWFGFTKRFTTILGRHYPEGIQRHRLAYTREFFRYRDSILQAVFGMDALNEVESPLRIQVYVLEKSLNVPELQGNAPWKFANLLPPSQRPIGYISDRDEFKASLGSKNPRWNYFKDIPVHPIFQSNDVVSQIVWEEMIGEIPYRIFRVLLFGEEVGHLDLMELSSIFNRDLLEVRNQWFPFAPTTGLDVEVLWNHMPGDWSLEEYQKPDSNLDAPQAIYFGLIHQESLRKQFLRLLHEKLPEAPKRMSPEVTQTRQRLSAIQEKLNHTLNKLEKSGIQLGVLAGTADFKIRSQAGKDTQNTLFERPAELVVSSPSGLKPSDFGLSMPSQSGMHHHKSKQWVGIINPDSGKFGISGPETISSLFAADIQLQLPLPDKTTIPLDLILRRCMNQMVPLTLTYMGEDGQEKILSFLPSRQSSGMFYLFTQNTNELWDAAQKRNLYLWFSVLMTLGFAAVGIRFLRLRTIQPILHLAQFIQDLKHEKSQLSLDTPFKSALEIEELHQHFQQMAMRIDGRVKTLKCIGTMNNLMNQGESRLTLLTALTKSCVDIFGSQFAMAGVFENRLSRNPEDWAWHIPESSELIPKQVSQTIISLLLPRMESSPAQAVHTLDQESLKGTGLKLLRFYRFEYMGKDLPIGLYGCIILVMPDPRTEAQILALLSVQSQSILLKTWLDEIQEDTRKGWEVQSSLMPKSPPDTSGRFSITQHFSSARGLAGDWFDLFTCDQESKNFLVAAISDVSGKGVGPSLFGASSRAWLRAAIHSGELRPSCLLEVLNQFLQEDKNNSLFETLFLMILNQENGEFCFASAGHNKMLLLRANGVYEELNAKGMPLGMFAPLKFEEKRGVLHTKDTLILYTDGITELENPELELYGMDRMKHLILEKMHHPLNDIQKHLLWDMHQFQGSALPSDDVTLIMIRKEDA